MTDPAPGRKRVGRPFPKGWTGRPKGALDIRTSVGIETARALSGRAVDRLTALLDSRSHRVALEACKVILSYAWGLPKQTLELAGGFGDLSRELTAALAEARARRAALETLAPRTQNEPALLAGVAGAALNTSEQPINEPLPGEAPVLAAAPGATAAADVAEAGPEGEGAAEARHDGAKGDA